MGQPNSPQTLEPRISALEQRCTALAAQLAEAVAAFTPVGGRVNELSAGFKDANARLTALEATVVGMQTEPSTADGDRLTALEEAVQGLIEQMARVTTGGGRGTRLSSRLANIEAALERLSPPPPEGGIK